MKLLFGKTSKHNEEHFFSKTQREQIKNEKEIYTRRAFKTVRRNVY